MIGSETTTAVATNAAVNFAIVAPICPRGAPWVASSGARPSAPSFVSPASAVTAPRAPGLAAT